MIAVEMQAGPSTAAVHMQVKKRNTRPTHISIDQTVPPQAILTQAMHPAGIPVENMVSAHFYPMYMPQPRPMPAVPPQAWQATSGIAPQQTQHIPPAPPPPPPPHPVASDWEYEPTDQDNDGLVDTANSYDYRYREDQPPWVGQHTFYEHSVCPNSSRPYLC